MSRIILTGPATYYVDGVNGCDTNDGSAAHPWKTIQFACCFVAYGLDCAQQHVTIQLASGSYGECVTVATQPLGSHVFTIRGNPQNPGSVLWARSDSAALLSATDYGAVVVDGLEFGYYATGGNCLQAFQFGIIDLQNCLFGSCQGGVHIKAANSGSVNITGPYAIDGNADHHIQCDNAAVNLGAHAVTMNNNQTIASFISVTNGGYVAVGGSPYSGIGSGGGTYGKQYEVTSNGVLRLNGVTLPGNAAGTSSSGGQVV